MTITRPVRGPGAAPARGHLRVLLVEDDPDDAELIERELRDAGFEVAVHRVMTEDGFLAALGEPFDIVLADFHLPCFDGLRALDLVNERGLGVPFVIVSGEIGEELAVDAMRHGASDYLLKDRLARLAPAVDRVLYERDLRDAWRRAEEEKQRAAARFGAFVEHLPSAVVLTDAAGIVQYANSTIEPIIGWSPGELVGKNAFDFVHPDHRDAVRLVVDSATRNPCGSYVAASEDRMVLNRDGTSRWVRASITNLVGDPSVGGLMFNIRDVTDLHEYQDQLEHQALHDALTGMPNRVLFRDRIEHAIDRARELGHRVAVIALDIDGFQAIVETLGHEAGDELVREAASRLAESARTNDTVARLSGDTFAILVEGLRDEHDVHAIACSYKGSLRDVFHHLGHEVQVDASCGIAVSSRDSEDADTLLRDATAALSHARVGGTDHCEIFDATLRVDMEHRLDLEQALQRAFEQGDFRLDYQPIVSVADGYAVAFEGLLRWQRESRGSVAAGEFIGVLESSRLVGPVGEWVLEEACRQLARWSSPETEHVLVSANLSARQVGPALPALVAGALAAHGVDPPRLWLELTETALMADPEVSERVLWDLHELGVRLVIDDFGTGYSSLAYLKRFPVDLVKIDYSFVRGLGIDRDDTAIVAAVIGVTHALGLRAVAEGVETEEQLAALRALDCDFAQGYYFARPQPAMEAMRASASWKADPGA